MLDSRKVIIGVVVVCGSIFLGGCKGPSATTQEIEMSPFTGIPCAPPCWQGLVIGESNEVEVTETLPKLTYIKQDSIRFHEMLLPGLMPGVYGPGLEITADCIRFKGRCLSVIVVDDRLVEVNIFPNYDITLTEAIEYLGDPDFIGYQESSAEIISCQVLIVWNARQLILGTEAFEGIKPYQKYCNKIPEHDEAIMKLTISVIRYLSVPNVDSILMSNAYQFFDY